MEVLTERIPIPNPNHKYSKATNKKIKSKKQARRHENLCYLLSLVGEENFDDFDDNIDYNIDNRASPFSRLFLQNSNLEIWTHFISCSGEDQDKFIEQFEKKAKKLMKEKSSSQQASQPTIVSAEENFNKIDKSIRTILKREISMECVKKYEIHIIRNFAETKEKKQVINDVSCSFERKILHGICQYHSFRSKSISDLNRVQFIILTNDSSFENSVQLHEFLAQNF